MPGRPVKQCEHCRGARKSKSHHAKCDCGDKKDKDLHKDKGDAKTHDNRCQCHSGGKCLCGTKKEDDELKIDTSRQTLHDARAKPKLTGTHSESHLTVFANGHHKPCHRNNNSAHVSGLPYKIPRPHTLHGHAAFSALSQDKGARSKPDVSATRSMDTHSLSNTDYHAMFGSTQPCGDKPLSSNAAGLEAFAFQDVFNSQTAVYSQEGASPDSNVSDTFPSQQWPWIANITPVNSTFGVGSLSTSPSQDCLPNLDNGWDTPSAGFDPIWSATDLPLDPSKFNDDLAQPISHSGESKQSGPGLTVASSAHSEIGDTALFGDLDLKPQSTASETLFWEDTPAYRFNPSVPSERNNAPVPMATTASMPNMLSFDAIYAKSMTAAPSAMTSTATSDFAGPTALAMPSSFEDTSSFEDVVPIDPWPLDQSNGAFNTMNNIDFASYANNGWF
ncbi:copper fist dna binding domain [Pyrenophora seminiperda CCB06]|uniref:Copper fist dna binding domain n=1 Tax=Pyrenophora seminiperda CCB06 TaxID=1302712 RepID=A0A3M7MJ78_9PLEO|nr:copper fist dna binding domain [Pyrenophora seminiperda CCB06]